MYEIDDFILTQHKAIPQDACESWVKHTNENIEVLKQFKINLEIGFGEQESPGVRIRHRVERSDDFNFPLSVTQSEMHMEILNVITGVVNAGILQYIETYPHLNNLGNLTNPQSKYHIVGPMGGYHKLHAEWYGSRPDSCRILVWHLSLTTHQDQGELEFLHQGKRIAPEAGRLIIFPAGFTHVHKGNIMRTEFKHYITGWVYADPEYRPEGHMVTSGETF